MIPLDEPESWPLIEHRVLAHGKVCDFVQSEFTSPSGERLRRQWVTHPGSVAVLALDDQDRVPVVHQYRQPVSMRLVELPAGILDVPGESALDAIRREFAEEAGLAADRWSVLADWFSTPGGSQEQARTFLATGLHEVARPAGFRAVGEEVDMGLEWVPFTDLLAAVRAGRVGSPAVVIGCLALALARATGGVEQLRPGGADWPARRVKEEQDHRLG